ncbi:MAG: DUF134 domain-containing protein, partial [Dehalococcoidia bacterium]
QEDRWVIVKVQNLLKDLVQAMDEVKEEVEEEEMPRPRCRRRIRGRPASNYFKPAGVRMNTLEEVILTKEEFEAVRLHDYNQLSQKECADNMQVSQPTFYRIISSARKKISKSIVEGKALKIE